MEVEEMQKQIESMMPTPQQIVEHLDKKLEEAKELYKTANSDQKYVLESLFPQLIESEDEKIRKEIIDFLLDGIWDTTIIDKVKQSQGYVKWISYLKNQGEQKFAWSEEDERMFNYALDVTEWYRGVSENKTKLVSNWLKSIKDRIGCKVDYTATKEWSEEDELMLNDILMCGERHCYLDAGNIAWLKELKDRVRLKNKESKFL